MLFGKEGTKGLRLNGFKLEVVTIGEDGIKETDILIHNAAEEDPTLHTMLARMRPPAFPAALGVIRKVERHTYDEGVIAQIKKEQQDAKFNTVDELLNAGDTWEIG